MGGHPFWKATHSYYWAFDMLLKYLDRILLALGR